MKTKIHQIIVLLYLSFGMLKAQTPNLFAYVADINSQMANIPYVFEGQIQSVQIFAGDEYGNPLTTSNLVWNGDVAYWRFSNGRRGYGYSLATIKVCKTYKGEIHTNSDRTFQVLTRCYALDNIYRMKINTSTGGTTEDKYTYVPSKHTMYGKENEKVFEPANSYPKQIFFCDKIDPIVGSNYVGQQYYSNFHSLYEMAYDVPTRIQQSDGSATFIPAFCTLAGYVFADQSELELFLSYIDDVNPTPPNYCRDEHKATGKIETTNQEPLIDHAENVKRVNERTEFYSNQFKLKANQNGNKSSMVDVLNLDMANERLVRIGADNWFEFDVMVSSNNSTIFFDNCQMNIQYNTSVFGASALSNNRCVITPAPAFNIPTYINPMLVSVDNTSQIVQINFGTGNGPYSRVQLSTTPTKMLTIRFKIVTCGAGVNLQFVNGSSASTQCWYTPASNTPINGIVNFSSVNFTGNITDNACEPIISSFNNNVPAGIGRVLTITGKYFGPNMGAGTVIFKDSDIGTIYPNFAQGPHSSGIQPYDVISWTDNQIDIRLPSIIDSAYTYQFTNLGLLPYGPTRITPGTGRFKVQNFTGTQKESSTPLTITYAHTNVIAPNVLAPTGPYRKKRIRLSSPTSSSYKVQCHPSINTYDLRMKPLLRRAMKDWACVTWINWYMGADTTKGVFSGDTVNQITMGPNNMAQSTLMETKTSISTCVSGNVETWYLQSFDILINPNPPKPWYYDTTGATMPANVYDMFQSAEHEFGHAHLLDHINDSLSDLMFWSQRSFPTSGGQRKNVYSSFGAVTGGNFVSDSLTGGLTCVGNHVLVMPSYCGTMPNGIKSQTANLLKLAVYPNPSSIDESVNIAFELENEQTISFSLYGISGNLIRSTEPEKLGQSVSYTFDTGNVSPGLYMLTITVGNKRQTVKLVKQ